MLIQVQKRKVEEDQEEQMIHHQIEILVDGKKIRKHHFADLLLLFPMFGVDRIIMPEYYSPGVYVEQKAIGFIASYEVKIENLNLEDLKFKLLEFKDKILLQKPYYQNKKMLFKRKETVIIYQNSFGKALLLVFLVSSMLLLHVQRTLACEHLIRCYDSRSFVLVLSVGPELGP